MINRYSIILVFLAVLLSACDIQQDSFQQLSNQELRTQWRECIYNSSKNQQTICQNYEVECQQREKQDNFACY